MLGSISIKTFDLKARVTSDIQLTEVLVHYSDASKKLRKMDTPDTYIGTSYRRETSGIAGGYLVFCHGEESRRERYHGRRLD